VIVTTTPARSPILKADWLSPGQHVTAMGSDQHDKFELEPACLAHADRYVADRATQTRTIGELRAAIAAGVLSADAEVEELGPIAAGLAPGRRTDLEITLADLTGTGVQDTAIATLARTRAAELGTGTDFES
jgi:ornithine cyclodeaminase